MATPGHANQKELITVDGLVAGSPRVMLGREGDVYRGRGPLSLRGSQVCVPNWPGGRAQGEGHKSVTARPGNTYQEMTMRNTSGHPALSCETSQCRKSSANGSIKHEHMPPAEVLH